MLNLNPTPIAWEETLDGLKQGLIDGAETWSSAVAYANMSPVVSQVIDLRFFSGFEHTAMNVDVFDALESAPARRDHGIGLFHAGPDPGRA